MDSPVRFVRTFSDDGESEWVDVVIPGYGRCQAQRKDLNFVQDCCPDSMSPTLMSLKLPSNPGFGDGVPLLLSTVGPMLKSLSFDGPVMNTSDSLFLDNHPHMEELSLRSPNLDVRLDFKDFDSSREQLSTLRYDCTDVPGFVRALTDASNPLGSCVRWLRVKFADIFFSHGEAAVDDTVEALLDVLECNQAIEFVDVVAPPEFHVLSAAFRAFHLKTLPKSLHPLPIECKVAFLSVMATTKPSRKRACNSQTSGKPPCQLNEHVLSKIFAFAAPPVIRKVYFRKLLDDDWNDDEDDDPL